MNSTFGRHVDFPGATFDRRGRLCNFDEIDRWARCNVVAWQHISDQKIQMGPEFDDTSRLHNLLVHFLLENLNLRDRLEQLASQRAPVVAVELPDKTGAFFRPPPDGGLWYEPDGSAWWVEGPEIARYEDECGSPTKRIARPAPWLKPGIGESQKSHKQNGPGAD